MHHNPVEIIRHKRNGEKLTKEQIEFFIKGAVDKTIPEYQSSAFLMSIFFQGMDPEEIAILTQTMMKSGDVVKFTDGLPKVDKHSTGGVGDKVSLILAPLVASCGIDVPMLAGRGLGHTGGTVDKLESIPGYNCELTIHEFMNQVKKVGVALMGQTSRFVPADKLFYSLRDVTATVESIPLITASILSKKAAEGIDGLVMDIKTGTGAFMSDQKDAEKLAKMLISTGKQLGIKVRALITDMNQPLGIACGNSLEVIESLEVLEGRGPHDLKEITLALAAHMIILGKKAKNYESAYQLAEKKLKDGSALKKFAEMTLAQGAKVDVTKDRSALKVSPNVIDIVAERTGTVESIETRMLGMLLVDLGGGRKKASDKIDFSVGFECFAKIGHKVKKGQTLATMYYNPETLKREHHTLEWLTKRFQASFKISSKATRPMKLIKKTLQ